VVAKEDGICAGIEEAAYIFRERGLKVDDKVVREGREVEPNQVLLEVSGNTRKLFEVERVAIGIVQRMSGIATMTSKAIKIAKEVNSKARIAATRKTVLGYIDQKAVEIGGGDSGRWRLDDCFLIRRNHVRIIGGIGEAVELVKKSSSYTKKIEVEVNNANDALEAAKSGADVIMMDNMKHEEIDNGLQLLKENNLRDKVLVDVSGGITLENLKEYAKHDVDIIAMGCLTHSVKALDANLRILGGVII
jgi:nicotinate-nucleotide pyrophosphorylase (carboxylating)